MTISDKILVGKIFDAHGIRGLVKIKSFTENPVAICDYSPLTDESGKEYKIQLKSKGKSDIIIVAINDISDRTTAETLKGTMLYASRSSIIDNEEDVLISELDNFKVMDDKDNIVGTVLGTFNYGAGDILEIEIEGSDKTALLSINEYSVHEINKEKEYIKIDREHLLES